MATAVIVGAGPGIGAAVARRFARERMAVGLIARNSANLAALRAELEGSVAVSTAEADAGDESRLRSALELLIGELGVPDVLVYNAAVIRRDVPGELTLDELLGTFAVNVGGALTAAAQIAPLMAERGTGTILITGGMPKPVVAFSSLSIGKAAVRSATALLDDAWAAAGIHVATVTVAGEVAPGGPFDPDAIAEQYLRLHEQPAAEWTRELLFEGVPAQA